MVVVVTLGDKLLAALATLEGLRLPIAELVVGDVCLGFEFFVAHGALVLGRRPGQYFDKVGDVHWHRRRTSRRLLGWSFLSSSR